MHSVERRGRIPGHGTLWQEQARLAPNLPRFAAWDPSPDPSGRVFARLNPQRFRECFVAWTQAVAQLTQGALISLDGKTVKASFDRATASSPVHMLSAWCSENGGLIVGYIKTDTTSNEITAIPALLQLLAIKGCIVTIDAMGCQTAIAGQIRAQGGDYLLALKSNYKKVYPDCRRDNV